MAINSSTARADIFKEFLAVIKDNITTPNVKVTNAFVDEVTQMPQVVIDAPGMPRQRLSFGTSSYDRSGDFEINIFAKTMKGCVELVDDVENAIFSNLDSLSVQNVQVGDSEPAHFELNNQYIHNIVIPVSFTFKR